MGILLGWSSSNQILSRFWISWHIPDLTRKVFPFKLLKVDDVEHIWYGPKILHEMRLAVEVLILRINSMSSMKIQYEKGLQNITELSIDFK